MKQLRRGPRPSRHLSDLEGSASSRRPRGHDKRLHQGDRERQGLRHRFRILTPAGEERHIRAFMEPPIAIHASASSDQWRQLNVTADIRLQQALSAAKLQAELQNQQLEKPAGAWRIRN